MMKLVHTVLIHENMKTKVCCERFSEGAKPDHSYSNNIQAEFHQFVAIRKALLANLQPYKTANSV